MKILTGDPDWAPEPGAGAGDCLPQKAHSLATRGYDAPYCRAEPIYDQEHINFAQHRDPLPGSGRVALHLLCRHRRDLGAGGVEHNG